MGLIDFRAVNDKAKKLIDIDLNGCNTINGGQGITGTIGFELDNGWKYFTGEHGFTDYVSDYGVLLMIKADDLPL